MTYVFEAGTEPTTESIMSKKTTVEEIRQMREIGAIHEVAKKEGWSIERTQKGHVKCYPPEGRDHDPGGNLISCVVGPSSRKGDPRGVKNFAASMIRAGLGGGTPNQPYPGKSGQPEATPPAAASIIEIATKIRQASKTKKETFMSDSIFTTTRLVVEKNKGKLTPTYMLEAFTSFLREKYGVKLPSNAVFTLSVVSEEGAITTPLCHDSEIEVEVEYVQEHEEEV